MTEGLVQSPFLTDAAAEPTIPGVSAAELDLMRAAAARFLDRTGLADAAAIAEDMRLLTEPAGAHAAGAVSPRRDDYRRQSGCHFMFMPYNAG